MSRGERVFVVQEQLRWDDRQQRLVSRFDLSPAAQYGELRFLLPATATAFYPRQVILQLKSELHKHQARGSDYLLLIGNPCLIGFTTAIMAARCGGVVNMLQWHPREKRYVLVQATHLLDA